MVPPKNDPRWKLIVQEPDKFRNKVTALPTRIMFSGLKMKAQTSSIDDAIVAVHAFFTKNEKIVKKDIELLFS